jgi:predicted GNAT family N-acyltransferase
MQVSVVVAESDAERAAARAIRHAVFVEEQAVPAELEIDGRDESCAHFLALLAGIPVAAARARVTSGGWKLERVAVLKDFRRRSVGSALVRRMLELVPEGATVYVHAQASASGFWEREGFVAQGLPFDEAGIEHRCMLLTRTVDEPDEDSSA